MPRSHTAGIPMLVGVLMAGIFVGAVASCTVVTDQDAPDALHSPLLDELVAKDAIREQIYNYSRGLDRMDKELAREVWHPDGTADYLGIYEGTGAGFVDWVWPGHERLAAHSHQMTNILIKVDGESAVSETYVMASLHAKPTPTSASTRLVRGRYADSWSRRDGRWAIDHRVFTLDFTTEHAATGPNAASASRRDRTDPSYQVYPH